MVDLSFDHASDQTRTRHETRRQTCRRQTNGRTQTCVSRTGQCGMSLHLQPDPRGDNDVLSMFHVSNVSLAAATAFARPTLFITTDNYCNDQGWRPRSYIRSSAGVTRPKLGRNT